MSSDEQHYELLALSRDDIDKLFVVYRDYIKHENSLVNNRLQWNNTIQGLLLATFGIVVRSYPDLNFPFHFALPRWSAFEWPGRFVLLLISIMGLVASLQAHFGVRAAGAAVKSLDEKWRCLTGDFPTKEKGQYKCRARNPYTDCYPDLTGGGSPWAVSKGTWPEWMPLLILLVWLFLLFWVIFMQLPNPNPCVIKI